MADDLQTEAVSQTKRRCEMAELIVVGFHGTGKAGHVLDQLQRMEDDWTVDLEDAVAVYRDFNGTLRLDDHTQPTEEEGAGWGALFGGLLGLIIAAAAAPATGGVSAAATIAAGALGGGTMGAATGALSVDWWRNQSGLTEEFVQSVSAMLEPGDSAVFVLMRSATPDRVAERFRGYGGEILQTTLSPEQSTRLQGLLHGREVSA
jgi:uncharacterized membrane protein